MSVRLKEKYKTEILPALCEQFGKKNVMQAPKLEKIVLNMGVGDAIGDPRMLEGAINDLSLITGQRPTVRLARKSISNFKLREGAKIGCSVTLRGDRMYEFLDRLVNIAIPRIRDFRGTSKKFDKFGNYTLGLRDQTVFPEVDLDKVTRVRGMNITFVICNSSTAEESRELLTRMGMPFAR